jgi:hypothetical protein
MKPVSLRHSTPFSRQGRVPHISITTEVTNIVVTPTYTQVSVAFTKPVGASTVTVFATPSGAFTVVGGQSATGTSSPLVVTGLTNGESYTATAYWTLAAGQASLPSTASCVFTPN